MQKGAMHRAAAQAASSGFPAIVTFRVALPHASRGLALLLPSRLAGCPYTISGPKCWPNTTWEQANSATTYCFKPVVARII